MWQNIRKNHNPLSLDKHDKGKLFKMCYGIVYPFVDSTVEELYRNVEKYYQVLHYNVLLCINGYPVYKNKLKEELANPLSSNYDESKTLFVINEIFPNVYTKEQLVQLLGQETYDRNSPPYSAAIYPIYGGFMSVQDKLLPYLHNSISAAVERQNSEVATSESSSTIPVTNTAQVVSFVDKYDFPRINMNKQDIYDSFNYNSIVQKALSDYSKIGFDVDGDVYTFDLTGGKIIGITNGIDSDVDFKITTSWVELKNMITLHKEGKTSDGMKAFWNLNIPLKVKLHVASKIGLKH